MKQKPIVSLMALILAGGAVFGAVRFEHGTLEVPTYTFGRSFDVPPLFQIGNSKGVYPYAALDRGSLSVEPKPMRYEALTLENEYLKVVILPELGGRLWSAWDKVAGKELFYNPGVIKPSAYNHRGGWPVGNLEVYGPFDAHMLTWPGEPWVWAEHDGPGGGKSVVLSHVEHFFRNKLTMELALFPGSSVLAVTVRLHNPNLLPNRYLLWTNAGIPAKEGTRFIYPMTRTIGHDTAEYGSWPVFEGVDLSWYRNNETMLGVFGLDLYDDFIAAYDYDQDYGTVRYADRRIARGVKTWTWGVGRAGKRHLENYTDSGVPYIEVQSGRFVWDGNYEFIDPGKSDGWTEYWFGVGGLGGLDTASEAAALNLESTSDGTARVRIASTRDIPTATLFWKQEDSAAGSVAVSLRVGQAVEVPIPIRSALEQTKLEIRLESSEGLLLGYTHLPKNRSRGGELAEDSIPRKFGSVETLSTEEIFQKGLTEEKLGRLDAAETAYRQALERDANYTAANLRLALLSMGRFQDEDALHRFDRVLERDPSNGEAHYYAAVASLRLGLDEQARKHFFRLLPSSEMFEQRDLGLGILSLREGHWGEAREYLQSAAALLPRQTSTLEAYAVALRHLGETAGAREQCRKLLEIDRTSAFARSELAFLSDWSAEEVGALDMAAAGHSQGYLELATRYMRLGAWPEVEQIVRSARERVSPSFPELDYYHALALERIGQGTRARKLLAELKETDLRIDLFPFRRETADVLEWVLTRSQDDNASALLGGLYYSRGREDEGIRLWRGSPEHYLALRNLGWALLQRGESSEALPLLESAFALRPDDIEIVSGLSQVYARLERSEEALRLVRTALEARPGQDQLVEMLATGLAWTGDYDQAIETLASHRFGPRHQSYSLLHLYQAVTLLKATSLAKEGRFDEARVRIEGAVDTPENLGVDDFATLASSRLLFFEALTLQAAGKSAEAGRVWEAAAETTELDFNGEGLFRAVALTRLGRGEDARSWFEDFERVNRLRKQDNSLNEKVDAYYLAGLYRIFKGDSEGGRQELEQARRLDEAALFVRQALLWLDAGLFSF